MKFISTLLSKRRLMATVLLGLAAAAPSNGKPATALKHERDLSFNDQWRHYSDSQAAGVPVTDWRWLPAEPNAKFEQLAKGPLPDDTATGWQPYAQGESLFQKQAGSVWLQTTLTGKDPASGQAYLRFSSAQLTPEQSKVRDEQLVRGVTQADEKVQVFLNGQRITEVVGTDFEVPLTKGWVTSGTNVLTLLASVNKPTTIPPLGSVARIETSFGDIDGSSANFNDTSWPMVTLPHWDTLETYNQGHPHQGVAWYRKVFTPTPEMKGRLVSVEFGAAMQVADVWVNGEHRLTHYGGFLPFTVDLTKEAQAGQPICVAVRVDSHDNPLVPPGKSSGAIDFEYYNGLYRNVRLHITDPLHITDAVSSKEPSKGGILVSYPAVSKASAAVQVQTVVANDSDQPVNAHVTAELFDHSGVLVAKNSTESKNLSSKGQSVLVQNLKVLKPQLWHPDHPSLYQLKVSVWDGGRLADQQSLRIGIRNLRIDPEKGFFLNGEKLLLSGANRHQYYPWIGNALSDDAQYRELWTLKNAGWNFVRLAHYPQSPAVMQACDELGLVAIVCDPGWQYWNENPLFGSRMEKDIRDMVRCHRNHPSAIFWEVTINEGYAPREHVAQWIKAVHEELPGDQTLTCGDTREYCRKDGKVREIITAVPQGLPLDVYFPSWQWYRGEPQPTDADHHLFIQREYGDDLTRLKISDGDQAMAKNLLNRLTHLGKNLSNPRFIAASLWAFTDNLRGGSGNIGYWGAVDMTRTPKFFYYGCQSQRDPRLVRTDIESGPMVFIANYWSKPQTQDVVVASNCDQVELLVNGKSVGRQSPEAGYPGLRHPPFIFKKIAFQPGELKAVGYLDGKSVATAIRKTPQAPTHLGFKVEEARRPLRADGADCLFVRAQVLDDNQTIVPDAQGTIDFQVRGEATIVSETSRPLEGGQAAILIRAGLKPGPITIDASSSSLKPATITFDSQELK
jgi:beta-galactosidase